MLTQTLCGTYGVVVMADAKPRMEVRRVVERKASANECLLCKSKVFKRGLCTTHYGRYRIARTDVPVAERPLFDAKQIKAGRLLSSRQGQRMDIVNEFRGRSA